MMRTERIYLIEDREDVTLTAYIRDNVQAELVPDFEASSRCDLSGRGIS